MQHSHQSIVVISNYNLKSSITFIIFVYLQKPSLRSWREDKTE